MTRAVEKMFTAEDLKDLHLGRHHDFRHSTIKLMCHTSLKGDLRPSREARMAWVGHGDDGSSASHKIYMKLTAMDMYSIYNDEIRPFFWAVFKDVIPLAAIIPKRVKKDQAK